MSNYQNLERYFFEHTSGFHHSLPLLHRTTPLQSHLVKSRESKTKPNAARMFGESRICLLCLE